MNTPLLASAPRSPTSPRRWPRSTRAWPRAPAPANNVPPSPPHPPPGRPGRAAEDRARACDRSGASAGLSPLTQGPDAAAATKPPDPLTGVVTAPEIAADAAALSPRKKNARPLVTGGLPDPLAPGL